MITQYIYYYNRKRSMKYLNYFSPKNFKMRQNIPFNFPKKGNKINK
ncbi:MAG: hypothetical protein ACQKHC_00900 [Candidatus Phytoplasma pruni]|nr:MULTISPECIES: hypothetical protein [16SrIII (X-disease group)]